MNPSYANTFNKHKYYKVPKSTHVVVQVELAALLRR
jgi:hypothetical protein